MAPEVVATIVLVIGLASGCRNDVCARKSDCASGLVCSAAGLCVAPAATPDAQIDAAGTAVDANPDGGP
jgi:hypothetical protein